MDFSFESLFLFKVQIDLILSSCMSKKENAVDLKDAVDFLLEMHINSNINVLSLLHYDKINTHAHTHTHT